MLCAACEHERYHAAAGRYTCERCGVQTSRELHWDPRNGKQVCNKCLQGFLSDLISPATQSLPPISLGIAGDGTKVTISMTWNGNSIVRDFTPQEAFALSNRIITEALRCSKLGS